MHIFRKILSLFLILVLLAVPMDASAAEDTEDYIQRMIQYYLRFQEDAQTEITVLLDYISRTDPQAANLWRKIMVSWSYANSQMKVNRNILPDGLPQDDSLCIVIMGYGLRKDGSMKEELIDRLVVGLSSALKYPNAYVAVTGGATSDVEGITEARQMAQWLRERGISNDRLILETRAMSTVENAQRVHRLLLNNYPQVNSVAVITSDYHIRQSCAMFTTTSHYVSETNGTRPLKLVSNAANTTGKKADTLYTQAWGISLITGIPFEGEPETQPELSS